MNYRFTFYFIGKLMKIASALFVLPTIFALIYGEYANLVAFLPLGCGLLLFGTLITIKQPKNKKLSAREGFVIVAISWVFVSLAVAVSFLISGEIGSFMDCLFEAISGVTTTGASILTDVEILSKSVQALRLQTHWVGGMGILVLVLAILPRAIDASTMNIFKAEVPGPKVDKLTHKLTMTAKILYGIYTVMTISLMISFICAGMPIYDSILHAMSIAGTGGFSIKNLSLAAYNSIAIEIIATIFMILFGINANIFYFIILRKFTAVFKSEELRVYFCIIIASMLIIATSLSLSGTYGNFGESLRYSSFQVASIISTTGMSTADYGTWTIFAQSILIGLMFMGGCAGSTAGGFKTSRVIILSKCSINELRRAARPHSIKLIKLEGEVIDGEMKKSAMNYFVLYLFISILSFMLISLFEDIANNPSELVTNFTVTISALSNVGPAFGKLSPNEFGNYSGFSVMSKIVICFDMLAGRLEILPMLLLLSPISWRKIYSK